MKISLAPGDPLGEALHFLRMTGVLYCRGEFTAPWSVAFPPFDDCLVFHIVTSGGCLLQMEGFEDRTVPCGQFVLLPHGAAHRLASERGVPPVSLLDLPRGRVSDRYEIFRHGGGGAPTVVTGGAVRFEHPAAHRLVTLLPNVITLDAWNSPEMESIQSALRLMAVEAHAMRPGGEAVLTRLGDILVIQAIRSWMAGDPVAQVGWLGALRDRQIGRALALIHRDPTHPWTVASLAQAVGMSRSAFAARFGELVAEPPMHYVARWRMQLALSWLREDDAPVAVLANRLGYESEAAFSRSFKRFIGMSPGVARRKSAARLPRV